MSAATTVAAMDPQAQPHLQQQQPPPQPQPPQDPPEFILDVFADPRSVRDVVKGMPCLFSSMASTPAHQPNLPSNSSPPPPSACSPRWRLAATSLSIAFVLRSMRTGKSLGNRNIVSVCLYVCVCLLTPGVASAVGILHTIFFTRFFPSLAPRTREVLDLTLPYVDDDELETMIDQRAAALERQLDAQRNSNTHSHNHNHNHNHSSGSTSGSAGTTGGGGGRGQVTVQFFEKKRRKAWLSRGDEEVCWECWTVKVTVAEPRTESGTFPRPRPLSSHPSPSPK